MSEYWKRGKVCIYRPERKRKRAFTAKDVNRITKYAIKDGVKPEDIVVAVLAGAGMAYTVCKVASALSNLLNILNYVGKIGVTMSIAALLEKLIYLVTYGKFAPFPPVRIAAYILLSVLAFVQGIFEGLAKIYNDYTIVKDIADEVSSWCKAIRDLPQSFF